MAILRDFSYTYLLKTFHNCLLGRNYKAGIVIADEVYDEELLLSLCDYYSKRIEKEGFANESVMSITWGVLLKQHERFMNELMNKDLAALHNRLKNVISDEISIGLSDSTYMFREDVVEKDYLLKNEREREMYVFGVFDKLISLCEATGYVRCFNPDDPSFDKVMSLAPEVFLDLLMEKYNINLAAPEFAGGTVGLITKYGTYTQRDMYAIHLALTIHDKFKDKNITICEIGGGIGHLAFYLHRLGFKNISIVDLPTVSAIQLYFLGRNLGKDHGIKFLGPDDFTGKYDLVINADSLIEMKREAAQAYIDLIDKNTKYFISMNQETGPAQFVDGFRVCDMTTMKRINRQMSWVRRGWIYEEYVNNV